MNDVFICDSINSHLWLHSHDQIILPAQNFISSFYSSSLEIIGFWWNLPVGEHLDLENMEYRRDIRCEFMGSCHAKEKIVAIGGFHIAHKAKMLDIRSWILIKNACGIEIALNRLEARPTADQCIDCKTVSEKKEI